MKWTYCIINAQIYKRDLPSLWFDLALSNICSSVSLPCWSKPSRISSHYQNQQEINQQSNQTPSSNKRHTMKDQSKIKKPTSLSSSSDTIAKNFANLIRWRILWNKAIYWVTTLGASPKPTAFIIISHNQHEITFTFCPTKAM